MFWLLPDTIDARAKSQQGCESTPTTFYVDCVGYVQTHKDDNEGALYHLVWELNVKLHLSGVQTQMPLRGLGYHAGSRANM